MDIMRMEKGYLHWGHDISPAENLFKQIWSFALKLNKKEKFYWQRLPKKKEKFKK